MPLTIDTDLAHARRKLRISASANMDVVLTPIESRQLEGHIQKTERGRKLQAAETLKIKLIKRRAMRKAKRASFWTE